MQLLQWRKLGSNWPTLFTIGVVLYFAITALGIPERIQSVTPGSSSQSQLSEDQTATSLPTVVENTTTTQTATTKALKIQVVNFSLTASKKHPKTMDGTVTLQMKNTGATNVSFYPNELWLRTVGAESVKPAAVDSSKFDISPDLPLTLPVSFQVEPKSSATYQVIYQGNTVFTGKPF